MESPRKTYRLIGYLLVLLLLLTTLGAAWVQHKDPIVRALVNREDTSLHIAVLTQPAMVATYNPQSHKVILTTVARRKTPQNPLENATDALKTAGISADPVRYYLPKKLKKEDYWENARTNLTVWRNKPFIAFENVWDYLQALHDKRTNVTPPEFILLALDAARLELTDFTVKNLNESKKKQKSSAKQVEPDTILPPVEDKAPLAMDDRPLLVEILNASGVKGAAFDLTQYLREQNQKGLLQVDVFRYDNYPGEVQPYTRIIDLTGRRVQVKQLSTAIGVNSEIVSEKQGTAIFDARIIIGQDFKQPW